MHWILQFSNFKNDSAFSLWKVLLPHCLSSRFRDTSLFPLGRHHLRAWSFMNGPFLKTLWNFTTFFYILMLFLADIWCLSTTPWSMKMECRFGQNCAGLMCRNWQKLHLILITTAIKLTLLCTSRIWTILLNFRNILV